MDECIYIISHKNLSVPRFPPYRVLQVGDDIKKWTRFSDKEGDSIAEKNRYYAELTALYWIWKNMKKHKVIGISHYRRYFYFGKDNKNLIIKIENDLDNIVNSIKPNSLKSLLENVDIILPIPAVYASMTMEEEYKKHHRSEDFDLAKNVIAYLYPSYINDMNSIFNYNSFHLYNMFIMRMSEFDKYMDWLFTILFEMEKFIKWPKEAKQYRVFGFLAERMLNLYVYHNHLKVKELPIVYIDFDGNELLKNKYKNIKYYIKRYFPKSAKIIKRTIDYF